MELDLVSDAKSWIVFYTNRPFVLDTEVLELVHRQDIKDHPGRALRLDPYWINESLIPQWIRNCTELHGAMCRRMPLFTREDTVKPKYIIDIRNKCIVSGNQLNIDGEYVALSYQWGQTQTLQNTRDIRSLLMITGSLVSGDLAKKIPQTISDALKLLEKCKCEIQLISLNGEHIGHLKISNHRLAALFEQEATAVKAEKMELVATCKGYSANIAASELSEQGVRKYDAPHDVYERTTECYFVLWIEWLDGVAYRRGNGAVEARAWDK
ncbi:hypothetical protein BS50DRAFT_501986 [Corynespora cassiicola Philippines]|uniref:Heterokaryon incompatibility domain-containing protein n=1 Tax=Corynespora cassiicola Philippines TaxID=1448308 RepID=A0A2T2NB61_CORCC|nr:hypothetical protein BS50DRAFT_501986 [Corynespora cassiicola Philippines]